jgi:hypothetical protein
MNMMVEEKLEEKSNIVAACRITTITTLSSPSYSYITKKVSSTCHRSKIQILFASCINDLLWLER